MSGRRIACATLVAAAAALVAACTDLFHSTASLLDECQVNPASCGQGQACTFDSFTARQRAEHACAWLGSCEGTGGGNAFGPCMVQAILAFDCGANPNHRVRGDTERAWACLAQAESCGDVRTCVLPSSQDEVCSGNGSRITCAGAARVVCDDGGEHVENCALWSEPCGQSGDAMVCGAQSGGGMLSCVDGSYPGSCDNGVVHWCTHGTPVAVDCAGNGAGACGAFPRASALWVACVGDSDGDAGCAPTRAATCSGNVASSCLSGVSETVDCARLLGGAAASCNAGDIDPPFDWTSPCRLSSVCGPDACDGGILTSCARGGTFTLDCSHEGLGPCGLHPLPSAGDASARAACAKP